MVKIVDPVDDKVEDFEKMFDHCADFETWPHRDFQFVIGRSFGLMGAEYNGVFSAGRLAAVVNTWAPEGPLPYRHIGKAIVAENYRRQGLTRGIIEWRIKHFNQALSSSDTQTHLGSCVWRFMMTKNPTLQFSLWTSPNSESQIINRHGNLAPDPWRSPHSRIIARPFPQS